MKIYRFEWLLWDIDYDINWYVIETIWMCPACKCKLTKSKEAYSIWEYKYNCAWCDFKITFNKKIEDKWQDFLNVLNAEKYKDAEIVNLDWDLIRVQREWTKDEDYRIDSKISKNKKWQLQLMILAWSKKEADKTQLFIDPINKKLSFDSNDSHPNKVFSKVIAVFKDSHSTIWDFLDSSDFE